MTTSRDRPLAEQVMDHVRRAVAAGELVPGAWYSVYQLSAVLGVSRSPVREALVRLEETGLVRFTRNRGFQVLAPGPVDVAEIFALRLAIEPAAAHRAALHAGAADLAEIDRIAARLDTAAEAGDSAEFFTQLRSLHTLLLHTGGSSRGARILAQLPALSAPPFGPGPDASRWLRDVSERHARLIAAVHSRDAEGAREALAGHLRSSGFAQLRRALSDAGDTADAAAVWERHVGGL